MIGVSHGMQLVRYVDKLDCSRGKCGNCVLYDVRKMNNSAELSLFTIEINLLQLNRARTGPSRHYSIH
jgi:hypothetical protein